MAEIIKQADIEEMTKPGKPSGSQEYLSWAEKKIKASLIADDKDPDGRRPLEHIMKKHGVRAVHPLIESI